MSAQHAVQAGDDRQDLSVLERSVASLLRHVARLLVGRLTLSRLQTILREIFVQEAEAQLRRDRPGRNVPLSQLALLTGLDTRTLIRIRGELSSRQAEGNGAARISDMSSEAKVVEAWAVSPKYRDPDTGRPRTLQHGQPGSEFEQLVKQAVTARGVTVQSVLERLLATGTVAQDSDSGDLSLLTERFTPFHSQDEVSLLANGLAAMNNLSGTVCANVGATTEDRVFQRELWTFRLDPARRDEFHDTMRRFLVEAEQKAEKLMTPLESEFEAQGQVTAGIGLYYFEET